MTKENKISLLILLIGTVGLAIYWFIPVLQTEENKISSIKERIILPNTRDNLQPIAEVLSYQKDVKEVIDSGRCVLPLTDNELKGDAKKVQNLLLKNSDFLADCKIDNKLVHNDMMRILPAIISMLDPLSKQVCKTHQCYTAEKYNFVTNTTTRAIVDIDDQRVLSVKRYTNMQPDISLRLTRIAQAIAINAPEVKYELDSVPTKLDISMANVRGSLQESPCENSKHLCVAPTFSDYQKEQALWVVIDLTDLKLVAAKWAGLGKTTTPACISERSLQNRYIMENFCQKDTLLEKDGWKITYQLTGSDGLEVRNASFNGEPVFTSAKIVDWHVSYQEKGNQNSNNQNDTFIAGRRVEFIQSEDKFMFGYNDAMGCPMFSTSVVLPFNGPQISKLDDGGFKLTQDFRNPKWPMACNYRYENQFEFHSDGSFRVLAANIGRGCGEKAIYRPVIRIDMAVSEHEVFYSKNESWDKWSIESGEKVTDNNMQYKITSNLNKQKGYFIEPNNGQFNDNSRGDNASIYVTKFHADEGDQDLLTLGSCCDLNDDGINRYLENKENIEGENIVLWYVPRIYNDARPGHEYCWADTLLSESGDIKVKEWPCVVGPTFVPIKKSGL